MEDKSVTSDVVQAPQPIAVRKRSHKRSVTTFALVSIVNVALLVLLWTLLVTPAPKQSQPGANTSSTASLGDIGSPLIGKPAPDFTLLMLNGSASAAKIDLAAFRGKPIILNFWASWCTPCNDEAAFLHKSWPGLKSQGIVLIGIDSAENASNALKFMQKYALSYPNVQDTITSATASDYGVAGLPATIFIDRKGVVVAKWISALNQQGLQLEVAKLAR
ncbi:TlpA family protein disulfide reductase [Ktedonobacteria bacterium brp13]|nr:TlpA family protein disulfide reductase [Ktedonobacteria bacterium brp13]